MNQTPNSKEYYLLRGESVIILIFIFQHRFSQVIGTVILMDNFHSKNRCRKLFFQIIVSCTKIDEEKRKKSIL